MNDIVLTPDGLEVYDSIGKLLFGFKQGSVEITGLTGNGKTIRSWIDLLKSYFNNLEGEDCCKYCRYRDTCHGMSSDGHGEPIYPICADALEPEDYIDFELFKEEYLEEFKEENEIMEILTIYQERKEKELRKEYNEKKQAILDSDKYISRYNELINTFNASLEELANEEKAIESEVFITTPYNTTIKYDISEIYKSNLLHELDEETGEKSKALYDMLDEVKAMIAIVPSGENYDAKVVEILKNYDILDKKGKINA